MDSSVIPFLGFSTETLSRYASVYNQEFSRVHSILVNEGQIDIDDFVQRDAVTLPKGDWYIAPPVEGEYQINAQTDGARGQYISMTYAEGFQACIHIDDLGVVRCQLYRYNGSWPSDVDYGNLVISFRGVA